jgi:hypothetical protein
MIQINRVKRVGSATQAPFVEIADLLVDSGARLDLKISASLPWYINKEALQRHLRELADRHKK